MLERTTMTIEEQEGTDCTECGHPFDPHHLIATKAHVTEGGIILCNIRGCECISSWDVPPFSTQRDVLIPNEEELTRLRRMLQTEEV